MLIIFHGCGEPIGVISSERLVESLEVERLEAGYSNEDLEVTG